MGGTCILAASYDQSPANEEERINTPLVAKRCQHTAMSTKLNDFSLERYGLLFGNRVFTKIVQKHIGGEKATYSNFDQGILGDNLTLGKNAHELSWGDLDSIDSSTGACSFGGKSVVRAPIRITPMSYREILAEYGHTPESAKKLREEIESLMAAKDSEHNS